MSLTPEMLHSHIVKLQELSLHRRSLPTTTGGDDLFVVVSDSDNPLICQVVDDGEEWVVDENSMLNADHHFTLFKSKFGKTFKSFLRCL